MATSLVSRGPARSVFVLSTLLFGGLTAGCELSAPKEDLPETPALVAAATPSVEPLDPDKAVAAATAASIAAGPRTRVEEAPKPCLTGANPVKSARLAQAQAAVSPPAQSADERALMQKKQAAFLSGVLEADPALAKLAPEERASRIAAIKRSLLTP